MRIPTEGSIERKILDDLLYDPYNGDITVRQVIWATAIACCTLKDLGIEPYLPYVGPTSPPKVRQSNSDYDETKWLIGELVYITEAATESVVHVDVLYDLIDELENIEVGNTEVDYRELLKNVEPPSQWWDEAIEDNKRINAMTQEEAKRIYRIILETQNKDE